MLSAVASLGCALLLPQEPGARADAATSVTVTPKRLVLAPGADERFTAALLNGRGDPVAGRVAWQATGGVIDDGGRYVAGPAAGEYHVAVAYGAFLADTATVIIDAADAGPTALLTYHCVGLTCTFDGTGSTERGSAIVSYEWEFGDGMGAAGAVVDHTFAARAEYTVTLRVTDERQRADSTERGIDPAAGAPPTWIYPGDDIQAAVNAHPAGTEFLIKAGIHRLQRVVPKRGNVFVGEPGAILTGARVLTEWVREGGSWVASGQVQQNPRHGSNVFGDEVCADGRNACIYPEDLFVDGAPLEQVTARGLLAPGTWYFDYATDKIYMYDDPAGRTVETSVAQFAFRGSRAHGLVVRGLIIEKYANAGQTAALESFNADHVVFEGNEVRFNHGKGISIVGGVNGRIANNHVHHQGQLGVSTFGTTGLAIEGNEIAYNGYAGYSMFWEAGGSKFVKTNHLAVRGNYAHHNRGNGLWTDIDNVNTVYEDNLSTANTRIGIYHEISYEAVIRNNTVLNNGEGGITVAHSRGVEVHGNTVTDNANGILGIQRDRGSGSLGPYQIRDLHVHDNVITMSEGLTGLLQYVGDDSYFISRNVRFESNTYLLGTKPRYFAWLNDSRTAEEWRAYGHDATGTFKSR